MNRIPSFSLILFVSLGSAEPAGTGKVEITVRDQTTDKPLAFRIRLENNDAQPRRTGNQLVWGDKWVSAAVGTARFELPTGRYIYDVEHGPEYEALSSLFVRVASGGLE